MSDLRDFRVGLALTQTQMASIIGVDRAHLSRLENGHRRMTPDQLLSFGISRVAAREAALKARASATERKRNS